MDSAGYDRTGTGERRLDVSGYGPLLASTCQELIPTYPVDVNGYYRELGIPSGAKPTRKQLREAYQALDGQNSARLTAIFKLLLDDDVRTDYNRRKVGDVLFDDLFSEEINRSALATARQRGASQDEVLDEWGLSKKDMKPPMPEAEIRSYAPTSPRSVSSVRVRWPWSYYREYSVEIDTDRLSQWQQLLVRYIPVRRFAVGYTGVGYPFSVQVIGGEWTVLLNEDMEPTEEMADKVRQEVLQNA